MNSNNLAALVLATGLWIGLAAWAMGGGSTRPNGEFWTSTSSAKVASHPTLVRGSYPRQARAVSPVIVVTATTDQRSAALPFPTVWEERSGAAAGLAPQPRQDHAVGAVSTECDPTHGGARLDRHERHH
jgi:uncharacterized protein (DUF58 family)